jgi:hypothetical protein
LLAQLLQISHGLPDGHPIGWTLRPVSLAMTGTVSIKEVAIPPITSAHGIAFHSVLIIS